MLTSLTGEHDAEDVRIERVAVRGHPRLELIERSTGAQLVGLVGLGDRGRGGFPGQALLHNTACPAYLVHTLLGGRKSSPVRAFAPSKPGSPVPRLQGARALVARPPPTESGS